MMNDPIPALIEAVDPVRLKRDLYYIAADPLPFRKLNFARAGQTFSSLEECDDYLEGELSAAGYQVEREGAPVQAFRNDPSKPVAHRYSPPLPEDPWFTAVNLYAERTGLERPEEIVLLLAHKDSQSWVASPGANDNAVGTVALLEIARILGRYEPQRTIRFLFCNEEHRPWTSVAAAENARLRGDRLVAVMNLDSLTGKPRVEWDEGRRPLVSVYTEPEGERIAMIVGEVNERYGIGLEHRIARRDRPGDDDGSFVNAGFPAAIINIGSWPYAEPNYHTEHDTPDQVDFPHLALATRASLAAAVALDRWTPDGV